MKNKKAKNLLINTCIRVNEIGEVSWMNSISIMADGSTLIHSEYLGGLDDSAHAVAQKGYHFNLPIKDCVEVL